MTTRLRPHSEDIRLFILKHLRNNQIAAKTSEKFRISRQAVNKHLRTLVAEGTIVASGNTQSRTYKLAAKLTRDFRYEIGTGLEEDVVWRLDIRPLLETLPKNVLDIWQWAFTEMFNNAIDHSEGENISVDVTRTALFTEIMISDDGIGISKKLQEKFGLEDDRQALLELSKGKLTTDPSRHSGQGIFFTSRMVNDFTILSSGIYFNHKIDHDHDWMLENREDRTGTAIFLKVHNHTARTRNKVLAEYSVGKTSGFNKTVVPVDLARYGNDQLISRSQAKRLLARVEEFAQVVFDFSGVDEIGQAFADEIFRVFAIAHPEVKLFPINTSKSVRQAVQTARTYQRANVRTHEDRTSISQS